MQPFACLTWAIVSSGTYFGKCCYMIFCCKIVKRITFPSLKLHLITGLPKYFLYLWGLIEFSWKSLSILTFISLSFFPAQICKQLKYNVMVGMDWGIGATSICAQNHSSSLISKDLVTYQAPDVHSLMAYCALSESFPCGKTLKSGPAHKRTSSHGWCSFGPHYKYVHACPSD